MRRRIDLQPVATGWHAPDLKEPVAIGFQDNRQPAEPLGLLARQRDLPGGYHPNVRPANGDVFMVPDCPRDRAAPAKLQLTKVSLAGPAVNPPEIERYEPCRSQPKIQAPSRDRKLERPVLDR